MITYINPEVLLMMINVTYEELVNLRTNKKLIPGQQYRITDYITTTTQENTRSAGHQFDVIVTADNENTLNEVARACRSEFDIEKYKDAYSSTLGDKMLYIGTQEYEGKEYHLYEAETFNDQMLVDFSHSLETYPGTENFYPFEYFPSYTRSFDGSDWGVWECGKDCGERIAFKYEEPNYFDPCKLESWQIWYSLDNDAVRFPWASVVKVEETIISAGDIKIDFPIDGVYFEGTFYKLPFGEEVYIFHGPPVTVTLLRNNVINVSDVGGYINSERPIVVTGFQDGEGKGVIYRMIDEYNNDLPYDFKNIIYIQTPQFQYYQWGNTYIMSQYPSQDMMINGEQYYCYKANEKPSAWSDLTCWVKDKELTTSTILYKADGTEISYGGNIISVSMESGEYYTFSDINGKDFSVEKKQCHNNIIKRYKNGLNKIIFKNQQTYCYSNTFGNDCYGNTFGNDCYSNTFGNDCYGNTFVAVCFNNTLGNGCNSNTFDRRFNGNTLGHKCNSNTFKSDCYDNSFGEGCCSNSFGSNCYGNTFGDDCCDDNFGYNAYNNSFGNNCYGNTFGDVCYGNTFGNDCYSNTFGGGCSNNTFSNQCRDNTFGSGCSNNTFSNQCHNNTFIEGGGYYNTLGDSCYSNTFGKACNHNTFGNSCYSNTLGDSCDYNTFGKACNHNTFGNSCYYNTLGNNCESNTFGGGCDSNTFGSGCDSNTFGKSCESNTLGDNCESNTLGDNCYSNTFGSGCDSNTFGSGCDSNTFGKMCRYNSFSFDSETTGDYFCWNTFGNAVQYVKLLNNSTASTFQEVRYYKVADGTEGINSSSLLEISVDRKNSVEKYISKNSSGEVKVFCLADMVN